MARFQSFLKSIRPDLRRLVASGIERGEARLEEGADGVERLIVVTGCVNNWVAEPDGDGGYVGVGEYGDKWEDGDQ